MIFRALDGDILPIYGNGQQIRDWLHVDDHIEALLTVLKSGNVGETYCIGGSCEVTNLKLVTTICELLDKKFPERAPHSRLIRFTSDREGHDQRYSINVAKIQSLGWTAKRSLQTTLAELIEKAASQYKVTTI